ncbi:MAG: hypothetical protein AAF968_06775 [Pseudomonadota bacterium]
MGDTDGLKSMTREERRTRNDAILERSRAAVASGREALRKGKEVQARLNVTREQLVAFLDERRAVAEEKAFLKGQPKKKKLRVRTKV